MYKIINWLERKWSRDARLLWKRKVSTIDDTWTSAEKSVLRFWDEISVLTFWNITENECTSMNLSNIYPSMSLLQKLKYCIYRRWTGLLTGTGRNSGLHCDLLCRSPFHDTLVLSPQQEADAVGRRSFHSVTALYSIKEKLPTVSLWEDSDEPFYLHCSMFPLQ